MTDFRFPFLWALKLNTFNYKVEYLTLTVPMENYFTASLGYIEQSRAGRRATWLSSVTQIVSFFRQIHVL